jgi:hypothetical protein
MGTLGTKETDAGQRLFPFRTSPEARQEKEVKTVSRDLRQKNHIFLNRHGNPFG